MKLCTKCEKYKSVDGFYKDRTKKDGLCSWCKICKSINKQWHAEYYKNNKEKILHKTNKYKRENKNLISRNNKLYYSKNKEVLTEKEREYYRNNKERIRSHGKLYYKNNKGHILSRQKNYKQTPRGKFNIYKESAKNRNIGFDLSFDDFIEYWNKPCEYCGVFIDTIGIDRTDNSNGYISSNIMSCCADCNLTKNNSSYIEWINYIKQVVIFYTTSNVRVIEYFTNRKRTFRVRFGDYKYSAKKRNIIFDLSFEEFCSFIEDPCHYCGTITKGRVGIDRINNNAGYFMKNCVCCCKVCNSGKSNKTVEKWREYLGRLVSENSKSKRAR